jgi:hypothetical protein
MISYVHRFKFHVFTKHLRQGYSRKNGLNKQFNLLNIQNCSRNASYCTVTVCAVTFYSEARGSLACHHLSNLKINEY